MFKKSFKYTCLLHFLRRTCFQFSKMETQPKVAHILWYRRWTILYWFADKAYTILYVYVSYAKYFKDSMFKISGIYFRFFYILTKIGSCFWRMWRHVKLPIILIKVMGSVLIPSLNISNSPIQKFKLDDSCNCLIVQDFQTQNITHLEIFMLLLNSLSFIFLIILPNVPNFKPLKLLYALLY